MTEFDEPGSIWTPRLLIRPVELADVDATVNLMTADVAEPLLSWSSPLKPEDVVRRIERSRAQTRANAAVDYAILIKEGLQLAGWFGLWVTSANFARLGYWLGSPFQRQGLMREALSHGLPNACAVLSVTNVEASVPQENRHSAKVLEALGFAIVGEELVPNAKTRRTDSHALFHLSCTGSPRSTGKGKAEG